jgi:diacylglycerol kinase family enzyme
VIELDQRRHRLTDHASTAAPVLLVVNASASGVGDANRTAADLLALVRELGGEAAATVTHTEAGLWEAMRAAVATQRRLVLVGGDGSLHAAANAPLSRFPELALVPAGRANNIARALGIPTTRPEALDVAVRARTQLLDALVVSTPERTVYALEAVSAGFHAAARTGYTGANSSDLRQGAQALARAVRTYAPRRMRAWVDGRELASDSGAQLFVANLPYFGFGFQIDPWADATDGRLAAILIEAPGRAQLLQLLGATYRGRHIGRPGVERVGGRYVELTEPLPLVADALPLGTTRAAVGVAPAHLRVAAPGGRA